MFSTSSQCKYWMFSSEHELYDLSKQANSRFITGRGHDVNIPNIFHYFLSPQEEAHLRKHYEYVLKNFCLKFNPAMPKSVMGTALQYYKRFYLNNSVMDYHPKQMLITCLYLACKVEEFNVSIEQFIANVRGDKKKATDIVLSNELLLMHELKYHLSVHNPIRPVEGFFIDLKTRYPFHDQHHYEDLRVHIQGFIDASFLTNACFLYSPSQIALASVIYAANKEDMDISRYLNDLLFPDNPEKLEQITKIVDYVQANKDMPSKEQTSAIEKKLESCRNQAHNPDSKEYRRSVEEDMDEDDVVSHQKYAQFSEEQRREEDAFVEKHALGRSKANKK